MNEEDKKACENYMLTEELNDWQSRAGFRIGFRCALEYAQDKAAQVEPIRVTDSMAYDFHNALDDSPLNDDDVEQIKTGLRAVLVNTSPVAEISHRLYHALGKLAIQAGKNKGWEEFPEEMEEALFVIAQVEKIK